MARDYLRVIERRLQPLAFVFRGEKIRYVIADIKVTENGWIPDYAASVRELVHKHRGKCLSRSGKVKTLEGKPLDTTCL
jgi:uncharacterized protein (DUF1330 family)